MNKDDKIRQILVNGLTEDEFIEKYDEMIDFIGFKYFSPADLKTRKLASLEKMLMPSCLSKIYRMNPTKNSWANYDTISDKLKLFLSLKGEKL
jgi:hypothetical protein